MPLSVKPETPTTAAGSYDTIRSPMPRGDRASMSDIKSMLQDEDAGEEEEEYKKKTTAEKIRSGVFYTVLSLASLYFFMVAVKLIGDGFTLALGCSTKGAFDFADNPVAGLMIGTVATALLHSSGTVTSIVVALVGAGGMTIRQGVYVIMGANVGTCVTCIMVAFGQVGDRARFQRAMAAATVHDMYNIWSVFVMFPIEVLFHPLEELSRSMSNAKTKSGAFKSPVDVIVNPLTEKLLVVMMIKNLLNLVFKIPGEEKWWVLSYHILP
ncbi:Sodium-dependent phosphate transporter, partial [Globisporangium splendens]